MRKTAFMLQNGRPVSVIVGRDIVPNAFKLGAKYTTTHPVDQGHETVIPAGAGLTVTSHHPDSGVVILTADAGREVVLQPFNTDDIVWRLAETRSRCVVVRDWLVAAIILLALLGAFGAGEDAFHIHTGLHKVFAPTKANAG